jgi:hypothetical protein
MQGAIPRTSKLTIRFREPDLVAVRNAAFALGQTPSEWARARLVAAVEAQLLRETLARPIRNKRPRNKRKEA